MNPVIQRLTYLQNYLNKEEGHDHCHKILEEIKENIKKGQKILVAEENDNLIGVVRFASVGSKMKIARLAVLSTYRCRGIGGELINAVLGIAQKKNFKIVALDVMEEKGLVPFYEKFGFKVKYRKKHQNYHDVYMEKIL